eukprot:TRINITY_DN8610_c0_g2_i1.p2 TRINITY_DN8610_c0_g2~~TRINITY_DN8610_c0_g2_i1.p2  ORF type:complete len:147 (+),score=8.32 TRINITY_DN8610_c0_g2_i1:318-758(+)
MPSLHHTVSSSNSHDVNFGDLPTVLLEQSSSPYGLQYVQFEANIERSDKHTLLMVKAGVQLPFLPLYKISKQMCPLLQIWGCIGGVSTKITSGGSRGQFPSNVILSLYSQPSQKRFIPGSPSGPCIRIIHWFTGSQLSKQHPSGAC